MKKYLIFVCVVFQNLFLPAQETLKLDQFLNKAMEQSEQFQAIELSIKALKADIESRDLGLSTELSLAALRTDDKKDTFSNFTNRESKSNLYTIGLNKKFSTGTNADISLNHEVAEQNTFAVNPMYRSDWQISISQDLWKNFFGKEYRNKEKMNINELKSKRYELALKKQLLLSSFEEKYWDLAYLHKQLEFQKTNLKRSEQILDWTAKRLRQSAARESDLIQAKALLASRKLDMIDLQDQIEKIWVQLKIIVPNTDSKMWKPDVDSLLEQRSVDKFVMNSGKHSSSADSIPAKLDSLIAKYRSEQVRMQLKSVQDENSPSLQLFLAHGRNGIRSTSDDSVQRATEDQAILNQIGLSLTVDLDLGINRSKEAAALLSAQASDLDAARLEKQNLLEWKDLQRQLSSLSEQLSMAKDLAKYEKSKSDFEQRFYKQGRSTISQAINFEVDAAAAELRVYRILNNIRKTESQARLFGYDNQEG
jgi:outer membrane protein TolC